MLTRFGRTSTTMSMRRSRAPIEQRKKEGLTLDNRLVAIDQAVISEASLERGVAVADRAVRGGYRRCHAQCRRASGGWLAERRRPDARLVDLPPRHQLARPELGFGRDRRGRVRSVARAFALASFLLIAACAKTVQVNPARSPPTVAPAPALPPPPPPPANARAAGVNIVPAPVSPDEASAARALQAFLTSCPALQQRQDKSLLTLAERIGPASVPEAATVLPGNAAGVLPV